MQREAELGDRQRCGLGATVEAETARAYLAALPGGGKAAKLSRALLALDASR